MKKKWKFQIEQNGGEYMGLVEIIATSIEQTGERSLIADGVEMEFDEDIIYDGFNEI